MSSVSLTVDVFVVDETGESVLLDSPSDGSDLAGHERTRTDLWGSDIIRSLGGRYLPHLAANDLWVRPDSVEGFLAECDLIRVNIRAIAARTGRSEDYISDRLNNMIKAARRASDLGGGIVVW
jgi:hypothetical protein